MKSKGWIHKVKVCMDFQCECMKEWEEFENAWSSENMGFLNVPLLNFNETRMKPVTPATLQVYTWR